MLSIITSVLPTFLWVQTEHRRAVQGHKSRGECRTLHLLPILCATYGEQPQHTPWEGSERKQAPTTQGAIHSPSTDLCSGLG